MLTHRAAALALVACSTQSSQPQAQPSVAMLPATVHSAADQREPIPAWTLTASDGTGLRLTKLEAKAVVEGPLAFTELHLRFENTENRVREGTFAITLPSRAAISRFAYEVNGALTEAEVVAKPLARRAYDDFLHRRVDPALLEKAAGNQFTARVFPIPARSTKHIVISYSQELVDQDYVLPLRGLPTIDEVSVSLSPALKSLHEKNWRPDHDFVAENDDTSRAIRAGTHAVGVFALPPSVNGSLDRPTRLTFLVDTSGSRAAGFTRYVSRVRQLIETVAATYAGVAVDVIAFDQETKSIYSGPAESFRAPHTAAFVARGAAGASDLARAAAAVAGAQRVVIVSDAVVTAGTEGVELVSAFRKATRVDVVLAGGIRDERVATSLTRAGVRPGDVFDLDAEIAPIARGLGQAVRVDVPIEVANATWSYPRTLPTMRAGARAIVYARLATPSDTMTVTIGGVTHRASLRPATPALVERAAAQARIEELETNLAATPVTDHEAAKQLRTTIETQSIVARVVSSQTAMLVLESDSDYTRYGIDRNALADILVIGPKGLEQTHRTFVARAMPAPRRRDPADEIALQATESDEPPPSSNRMALDEGAAGTNRAEGQYRVQKDNLDPRLARQQAIEEARAQGVLGSTTTSAFNSVSSGFDSSDVYGSLSGSERGAGNFGAGSYQREGAGNFGTGRGGMRGRAARVPAVAIGQPTAQGSLDKAIIRRYIKRHIDKISYCYERELFKRPDLDGTVTSQFVISEAGKVTAANAAGMNETVARCVADVIKHIEFPKTNGGGAVQVSYPFTFHRAGTADKPIPSPPSPPAAPPPPPPPPKVTPAPEFKPPTLALSGKLQEIAIVNAATALTLAKQWRDEEPTNVLAWVALGQAFEASGDPSSAARAYGSIIDLYSTYANLRRFAGERLERIGARSLAIDTYRRAVADRPDQVTGQRLLAYALVRSADYAGAWRAILAAADQPTRQGSYVGAPEILGRDVSMIASVYAAHGGPRAQIEAELTKRSLGFATAAATRFILYWESDANDVDLHVRDARGDHAYYADPRLASGGHLYADVTTGFGPECFEIIGTPSAGPYELGVHYFSRGAMGYGLGSVRIERFTGKSFTFEDRPFVIMRDNAYVALGRAR